MTGRCRVSAKRKYPGVRPQALWPVRVSGVADARAVSVCTEGGTVCLSRCVKTAEGTPGVEAGGGATCGLWSQGFPSVPSKLVRL